MLQSPLVFTVRGYEALFPWCWNPGCMVEAGAGIACYQLSLLVFMRSTWMWDYLLCWPPLPPGHISSLPQLPICTSPTHLDPCFFFNSLVFRHPYSSIFWLFWLFFVFRLVVILLMVVWGGKACLPMPPSWTEVLLACILRVSSLTKSIRKF